MFPSVLIINSDCFPKYHCEGNAAYFAGFISTNRIFVYCFYHLYTPHSVRTACSRVLLEKLIVTQLVKNSPRFLLNAKVRYRVHMSPTRVPILAQTNPVHSLQTYFFHIHSGIILPSTPTSTECSLPVRFSDQNVVYISHLRACYMIRPLSSFI